MKSSLLAMLLISLESVLFGQSIAMIESHQLPPLPNKLGLAGLFAGVSNDALIVAGGANFPDRPPWDGGRKVWHDEVYMLDKPNGQWRTAGTLPRPCGYGVALTADDGLVCLGGGDAQQNFADVFVVTCEDGREAKAKIHAMPPLPKPLANACGAMIGNTIHLAGGTSSPEATQAECGFYSLDLRVKAAHWRSQPTWPGPPRMMACAGAIDGSFYLMSGIHLSVGKDGKPQRSYLRDAYRYTPGTGWTRLADLPRGAAGAPSPMPVLGKSLILLGGDDGSKLGFQPVEKHPGFPQDIIAYNVTTSRYKNLGPIPVSRANLPAVRWRDAVILPSGEVRPGVRSPEVWSLKFPDGR